MGNTAFQLKPLIPDKVYFFSGQNVAILAHAIMKDEDQVPDLEIERAIQRKVQFEANPAVHTYIEETEDGKDE